MREFAHSVHCSRGKACAHAPCHVIQCRMLEFEVAKGLPVHGSARRTRIVTRANETRKVSRRFVDFT